MRADRIVVHSGSCGSVRELKLLNLLRILCAGQLKPLMRTDMATYAYVRKHMGKVNQLGNVEEVIKLCQIDERFLPTLDFGHINAQSLGKYNTKESIKSIFDLIESKSGYERAKNFHAHYSRIEYTRAGEKKHHYNGRNRI